MCVQKVIFTCTFITSSFFPAPPPPPPISSPHFPQGMNMIAAIGLLFLDEETTFWSVFILYIVMWPVMWHPVTSCITHVPLTGSWLPLLRSWCPRTTTHAVWQLHRLTRFGTSLSACFVCLSACLYHQKHFTHVVVMYSNFPLLYSSLFSKTWCLRSFLCLVVILMLTALTSQW